MYSKKLYLKEEEVVKPPIIKKWAAKKFTLDDPPVSEEVIDQLRELYNTAEYNDATEYLFGESHIIITGLTTFQANMLVAHAKLLSIVTKNKKGKDIIPNRNIKPYKNIWNTLEKCKR